MAIAVVPQVMYKPVLKIITFLTWYFLYWSLMEIGSRLANGIQRIGNLHMGTIKDRLKLAFLCEWRRVGVDLLRLKRLSTGDCWSLVWILATGFVSMTLVERNISLSKDAEHVLYSLAVLLSYLNKSDCHGNAAGQAWSYYLGYLKVMLPSLLGQPNQWRDEQGQVHNIVGLFILVPANCYTPGEVKDKEDRIYYRDNYTPQRRNVGGIVGRVYKHSVYEVQSKGQGESFYCFLEYATPLRHFATMSDPQLPYAVATGFNSAEMAYQAEVFYSCLEEILAICEQEILEEAGADSGVKLKDYVQLVKTEGDGTNVADNVAQARWTMRERQITKEINPVTTEAYPESLSA